MKRKLLITSLSLSIIAAWFLVQNQTSHQTSYRALIKNHPLQARLKMTKKERKKNGIPPNAYFDAQYLLEMNPKTGKTNPKSLEAVKSQAKSLVRLSVAPGQDANNNWTERGPNNIGGRTRVVFYDPNDSTGKRVFAGGVSGGLWVNDDVSNSNSSWSRVGIDENLSVSCFAIDPNDSDIWYVGTGEAYTGNDGVGNGIWISTNGGNSWSKFWSVDLENDAIFRPYYINQIVAWNVGGTTQLYFAVDGGIDYDFVGYGLSGWWKVEGNDINRIDFFTPDLDPDPEVTNATPYVFSDIEIAPDNSLWCATKNNVYGRGGGKVFRTTDGENFTEKYSFSTGKRVELSVSKTNANKVYVLAEVNNGVELVKTTNGQDFTSIAKPNDVDQGISANDFARNQAFYNLTLEVDPSNDEILYAGGIDLFRSTNGGSSWQQISKWSNNNDLENFDVSLVHADQHAVAFNPLDSNKGVFANDGGIYYANSLSASPTSETAIQSRNNNYNITQFYSGAIAQSTTNPMLLGGSQDNGSLLALDARNGVNSFFDIYGGDGVETFIDKDNAYVVVSYVFNTYGAYTLPLSNESRPIEIESDEDTGSFINVADLDDNLDILYTNGSEGETYRISRYSDLTTSPSRRNFTSLKLEDEPTAIKVSPYTTTSSTVFIGTNNGTILKATTFNTVPSFTTIGGFGALEADRLDTDINIGAISDIDFGTNENEILVTLHNYGINNIYFTNDGGTTWQVKDGDFPDIPVKAIKMNPYDENEVIIGTNLGVWRTENFLDDSPSWVQSQNGMSNVKVTKFDMRLSDTTVLASTYGRGLFTGTFSESLSVSNPIGQGGLKSKVILKNTIVNTEELKVALKEIEGNVDFMFFAINGQNVYQHTLNSSEGSLQNIPLTLNPGVYIVKVSNNFSSYSQRIVVSN
ncbi:T9SS type A sorting domain-containing protein [Ochrovirga pacifica]|uniref:T9SS type A sorting domain-containing protein n=1 Tax=Ochrovirga pacifica TaxID=1042376 RepID=UPI0002558E60|nr:T9SS type A sorting domain-containing protein [Ochrovirga pacifica]